MRSLSSRASAVLSSAIAGIALFAASPAVFADTHTAGTPVLNSDPGAPFTMYLDFAGFNYTGTWSGSEISQPGSTPALNLNGEASNIATFTAADVANIDTIFTRVADSYGIYNINVTTVDPAVAAGQASTDLARQTFYNATPDLEHMVIGSQIRGTGAAATNWYSYAADGVSGLGVFSKVAGDNGGSDNPGSDSPPDVSHTNWMFTEGLSAAGSSTGELLNGSNADYIGAVASHENGHAVGLTHQSDYAGTKLINEYAGGDSTTGPNSYTPIIGAADGHQRIAWRVGPDDNGTTFTQNDIALTLSSNASVVTSTGVTTATMVLNNDGIGHTAATATPLATNADGTVNFNLAKGTLVPSSSTNPDPSASTADYFSFDLLKSSTIDLKATDGTELLIPGVSDGVGMLQSTMTIYNALTNTVVGTATEDASTLFETYDATLGAGDYYADITGIGAHPEDDSANPSFNPSTYYNVGDFFLTGSGFDTALVPEPVSLSMVLMSGVVMVARRRRA